MTLLWLFSGGVRVSGAPFPSPSLPFPPVRSMALIEVGVLNPAGGLGERRKLSFSFGFGMAVTEQCSFGRSIWSRLIQVRSYNSPELKSTIALRQLYSAESTCSAFNFSTCSWKMRMWSMNATTRSAAIGLAWSPAAARSGATWSGMEHCAALSMNNSLQLSRSSPTWSVTCK